MCKLLNFVLFILIIVLEIRIINGKIRSPNCLVPFKDQSSDGCLGFIPRFYYDVKNDECILFVYGGCGGTLNNFNSKEECEQSCDVQPKVVDVLNRVQSNISPCSVPHEANQRCLGYIPRFYYDKDISKCVSFIYGGCGGTSNNFVTKEDCEQSCDVQPNAMDNTGVQSDSDTSPCLQPHESNGNCLGYIPRYYYDKDTSECVYFIYGGCGGTSNNFVTKEECEKRCDVQPKGEDNGVAAVKEEISPCSMPHEGKIKCLAHIPRFYYDKKSNGCVSFIYGGCGGTANNFNSKEDCEKSCLTQPERPSDEQDGMYYYQDEKKLEELYQGRSDTTKLDSIQNTDCKLKIVQGFCSIDTTRYAFMSEINACVQFTYTGCGGNSNNFVTRHDCEIACPSLNTDLDYYEAMSYI